AVLYPRIQEIKKLREVAFEAYEEHSIAKYLVSELENGDPGTEQWNAKCKTLKDIIDHHVEEEEDELFPQMKKLIARSELLKLGDFFDQYKKTGVRPIDESSWRKPTGLDLIPQPHL
ncbi:MAG: hemerythrin domain-containing protein, partial [Bdellovibrionia bacterium]